jgi:hypothetical protein
MDCDQTAMALPLVMYAVFLIANSFWLNVGDNIPTTNTAETGLTYLSKHEGDLDNTFLVTHPMTAQCCLIPRSYAERTDRARP